MIKFRGRGVFRCKDNEYLRANTKNMLQKAKKMLHRTFHPLFYAKDASFVLKNPNFSTIKMQRVIIFDAELRTFRTFRTLRTSLIHPYLLDCLARSLRRVEVPGIGRNKKEYLLQTRNLQQIIYQTNDFVIFGYFLSYFLFFSSPVRWAFRQKSPYSTW